MKLFVTCVLSLLGFGSAHVNFNIDGVFELDLSANTVPNTDDCLEQAQVGGGTMTEAADWNSLYNGATCDKSPIWTGVLTDVGVDGLDEIFEQGYKDTMDVNVWRWKGDGNVPGKADLLETMVYVTQYAPTGEGHTTHNRHDSFYFALHRATTSGATSAGFWLFQDRTVGNTVDANGDGVFTGNHIDGDLLIVAEFSTNSVAGNLFKWEAGELVELRNTVSVQRCGDVQPTDDSILLETGFCVTANSEDISVPWMPEGGNPLPAGSFMETGIDIAFFYPNGIPCFGRVMATTRSSPSRTASLKDFVFGDLDICEIIGTQTCQAPPASFIDENGDFVFNIDLVIEMRGIGTVYGVRACFEDAPCVDLGSLTGGQTLPLTYTHIGDSTRYTPSITISGCLQPLEDGQTLDDCPTEPIPFAVALNECYIPTDAPTNAPTDAPTRAPTSAPTPAPTAAPTRAPTRAPTPAPTNAPTNAPTASPVHASISVSTDCTVQLKQEGIYWVAEQTVNGEVCNSASSDGNDAVDVVVTDNGVEVAGPFTLSPLPYPDNCLSFTYTKFPTAVGAAPSYSCEITLEATGSLADGKGGVFPDLVADASSSNTCELCATCGV